MNHILKEKISGKPRILVVPLDWGLGHATRMFPVIRELLARSCDVWLAGEGAQEILLREEFPQLPFLHLDGYRVRYSRSATGLALSIFRQTHKIFRAIKKENAWLKKTVAANDIDAVISDNRFGLYHEMVPCIFITHQLDIKSSLGKWSENILQKRNYRFINRFSACWVPDLPAGFADAENYNGLAGELSHPEKKPTIPVKYIGPLSRFENFSSLSGRDEEKKDHLLIILSGPEPQRSILEDQIIKEISQYTGTATVVRGLPGTTLLIPSGNMIKFYNHLPADKLNKEMSAAEYVISRSGYSTIMDLARLQKKSILIPTPGQTEQEYLAKYLFQKQIAFSVSQKEFTLTGSLAKARQFAYRLPEIKYGSFTATGYFKFHG